MSPRVRSFGGVTLQLFIPLIAPEAPTALVPGAPEPIVSTYLRKDKSKFKLYLLQMFYNKHTQFTSNLTFEKI